MKKAILVLVVLANLVSAGGENFSENKKECEGGSVYTCLSYGESYLFGRDFGSRDNIPRDYIKAKFFLEKACKKDNVKKEDKFFVREAYFYLGYMYLEGLGVEKDDKKAFELFNTAYDGKLDELYYRLGEMYFRGYDVYSFRKVREDGEKSREYYDKSCDDGYPYACNDIATILYKYDHV
ncbi:tetratricopeptide repeat protein [Campylobacter concisus]|uniref:tetratricopeptide repeat protein n=1 Tax=Campylobacter concisus TaxID=199 RepID=UPI000CD9D25B|nr:tetratricopeptide repeat protein [Campylobacter concisus]MBE9818943.1 sel1 repeat family protein [Campylobacter concisus]